MHAKNDEAQKCANTLGLLSNKSGKESIDMNSVHNNELTFQQTEFHPVSHAGETWLTSSELAALGYKKSDAVTQIFSRYHDEFTEHMSTTLKMSVVRKTGAVDIPVRVFSLRGAHLVAMFATTRRPKNSAAGFWTFLTEKFSTHQSLSSLRTTNYAPWHIFGVRLR
jgi:prophage antirepressor-like protein